jgi:hypothetical protein
MLASALDYARRGWQVLPLEPAGKRPLGALVPHGLKEATTDETTIRQWWTTEPNANVGIATGAVSGLVVIDVDGADGAQELRELVDQHGRFKATWARTGSGGWHAYLQYPGVEVRNSAGKLGPGLDVRGDGGYVVAPPSIHPCGGRYTWRNAIHGSHLPPMPPWLLALLKPPEPEPPRTRGFTIHPPAATKYANAAVEGEAREVADASVGQRNHRLNVAAFKLGGLVAAGMVSESEVEHILTVAAQAAGLSEQEARQTIRSGLRAGLCHPREVAS